jgi:hypothetical protein
MDWHTNKHKIAADLCRTAREEYRNYCLRTQAATYTDSALADFETAISRQYGPVGDWDPQLAKRLIFHAHLYLAIAEQHLTGLEVLLPGETSSSLPFGPAARSVAEASGRAVWLLDNRLGLARSDARRRIARLLLDEQENAQVQKNIAYELNHPERAKAGDLFRKARDAVRRPGLFYDSEIKIDPAGGKLTLQGETMLGPSGFVRLAGEAFGDDEKETIGYYRYISAMTHPTTFAFLETLADVRQLLPDYQVIPWRRDDGFVLKIASNAVRAFYNAWCAWIGWTNTGMEEARALYRAYVDANSARE